MTELKVFVVDDDPFYLHIIQKQLNNLGMENVQMFSSGTECLENLHAKPDVVFLDFHMDTIDGYDVLRKIKRYDPNIIVVMVSGQEDIRTAVNVLKHGAFDYIQKGSDGLEVLSKTLARIATVKDQMERNKPGVLKKIFQFL